jgi:DNA-binding beta-propeller fold protein YncE
MVRFVSVLTAVAILLGFAPRSEAEKPAKQHVASRPILPGIQPGGAIVLPNQWSLRPAGKQVELGDFPVNMALHPSGQWLAILHAGYGEHEIIILDVKRLKKVCRVSVNQAFYGVCFSPDGHELLASGGEDEVVHAFSFDEGLLSRHREIVLGSVKEKFIPAGLATDFSGQTVYVAGPFGDAVRAASLKAPEKPVSISTGKLSYPYACLPDAAGKRLYVSLWGKAAVAVVDVAKTEVVATWPTESHPTEMALSPKGETLFVACANSTKVSVVDTDSGRGLETVSCSLYPSAPAGNTPSSLCLTPDGQLLFVANADANNIAVFNVATPGAAKPLGFIPVGWYPTCVRYSAADKKIYVTNGKGTTPLANPQGPNPNLPSNQKTMRQYIGGLFRGTLGMIDMPTPEKMAQYSKQAYACSPLREDQGVSATPSAGNPIPAKVGNPCPIKHCLYIIKENRTYDQVFGDLKQGNGDPNLCLFGERITPNHHALAREFVLLDNFYVDGEVSADGHQWSMGAYATDFVEKTWPLSYRPSRYKKVGYASEGGEDAIARPSGGYLWDRCAESGLSYRSYGEWIKNGKTPKDPGTATVKALQGHFDPWFRGFDTNYPDQRRADRFLEELKRFEQEGDLPRFVVMHLPNDHTSGSRPGHHTPIAQVADNDLALGRIVEAISKSRFWKETAMFVVEDDAQNGPDHVDAHRTVALVISPYTRGGRVDSSLYSTTSMLRTMELILGLKPMSQFDAAARPMYGSFHAEPDGRPYLHKVPEVDLEERNGLHGWGAEASAKFDLSKPDAVDDLLFNEVIWRSVRGAESRMPPPVRAAFLMPHPKRERDADD